MRYNNIFRKRKASQRQCVFYSKEYLWVESTILSVFMQLEKLEYCVALLRVYHDLCIIIFVLNTKF